MQEYTIDLSREPEDRWSVVDPAPIAALIEEAEDELEAALPAWQLLGLHGAAKALKVMFRDSEYIREIAGLAEHADVPMDKLLLMNLSYDLASSGFALPGMLGCTGALVKNGGVTIARTMDWSFPESIRNHTTIYRFVKRNHHLVTAGFPGFVGVVSGMSSRGIALTLNQAFVDQIPSIAMPVPWLTRDVLMHSGTFQQALRMLTETPAASAGFYLLTDGGQGALIESTGSEDTVTALMRGDAHRYLVVANHFSDEEPDPEERAWGDTFYRHEALEYMLLRDVTSVGIKAALKYEPVEHGATAHQLIFDPNKMHMTVRCPHDRQPTWSTYVCPSS